MNRGELFLRVGLTIGINALLFTAAMVVGSGHFGGGLNPVLQIVAVIAASLFMLPAIIAWLLVGTWAGPIVGGVAVATVQLGWVFWVASRMRQRQLDKRRAIENVAC